MSNTPAEPAESASRDADETPTTSGLPPTPPAQATPEAIDLARQVAAAAAGKLAHHIVAFDVSAHLAITDIFVIASAPNERQVGAIVDAIEEKLLETGHKPVRREGDRENRWVLLDYLDVVVHVQHDEERVLYSLERLWRDCPRVDLKLDDLPGPSPDADTTPAVEF